MRWTKTYKQGIRNLFEAVGKEIRQKFPRNLHLYYGTRNDELNDLYPKLYLSINSRKIRLSAGLFWETMARK